MRWWVVCGAMALMAAAPADARFDGTYAGTWRMTMSDHAAACERVDGAAVHVVVRDSRFRVWWRGEWAAAAVGADGVFDSHKIYQDHKSAPALLSIKGKIEGGRLEGDIGTERCAFHVTATRA